MAITRTLVIITLAVLGGVGSMQPPVAYAQRPDEAALIRELAERLLVEPGGGRVAVHLLPGRLPDSLPFEVPVPPHGRLLGSAVYDPPLAGSSMEAIFEADGTPPELTSFYQEALDRLGWDPILQGGRRQSIEGIDGSVTSRFWREDSDWSLDVKVVPRADRMNDIRVRLRAEGFGRGRFERLPHLVLPADLGVERFPGQLDGRGDLYVANAMVQTERSAAELEALLGQQFADAGWTRQAGRAVGAVAWSAWAPPQHAVARDHARASDLVEATLLVVEGPAPGRRTLSLRLQPAPLPSVAPATRSSPPGGGTPTAERSTQQEDVTQLRALAERLLAPGVRSEITERTPDLPSVSIRAESQFLPGQLPPDLPLELPLPAESRLVGSGVYRFEACMGDLEGVSTNASIFFDAPGTPVGIRSYYQQALAERGWRLTWWGDRAGRGFAPAVASVSASATPEQTIIRSDDLPKTYLNLSVVSLAAGTNSVRIEVRESVERLNPAPEPIPAAIAREPSVPDNLPPARSGAVRSEFRGTSAPIIVPMPPEPGAVPSDGPRLEGISRLPALTAPADVALGRSGGAGGGQRDGQMEATLQTRASAAELEAHFARQLAAGGWTRREGTADADLASSTWTLPGDDTWQGMVFVIAWPDSDRRLAAVRVASTATAGLLEQWLAEQDPSLGRVQYFGRAEAVLRRAQAHAQRAGQTAVSPEHLLLAILEEQEGVAARLLNDLGIDRAAVGAEVAAAIERQESVNTGVETLTPGARRALRLAVDEIERTAGFELAPEHLLLGLIREQESAAARVLAAHGATLADLRARLGEPRSGGMGAATITVTIGGGEPSAELATALQRASAESDRLGYHYLGSEHLLLALIGMRDSVAGQALADLGVELDAARHELQALFDEEDLLVTGPEGRPRMFNFLESAQRASRQLGSTELRSEHLLLAVLDDDQGLAVRVLDRLGVSSEAVRAAIERRLAESNSGQ